MTRLTGKRKDSIDIGLAVAEVLTPYGHVWSTRMLAAVCDCDHERIRQIERAALHKLRFRIKHEHKNKD
jgi:hypothetical protein